MSSSPGCTDHGVTTFLKPGAIALNVLVMNLEKLLVFLFVFIAALLCLLLGIDSGQCILTMPLNPQMAAS
jgi:hypothetical protein